MDLLYMTLDITSGLSWFFS